MVNIRRLILNEKSKIQIISIVLSMAIFIVASFIGYYIDLGFENEKFTAGTIDIFLNNLTVCLIFIIGILSFGMISLFLLFINGVYLGAALNYYIKHNSLEEMLRIFIPHAIFEIPAIILSASMGFLLILFVIEKGYGRQNLSIKFYLMYILKCTIIVIILLGIAAFIEVHVSMRMS
ncbi:stage II sporulation protein M [Bacillus wiedmannii]|uniref:stage II sporulation protein M n=1 Tax=Bacillus wiedmannii TaxID=1890302 RepID=UPI001CBC27CD|nr:stage II sporulation protein M [Bacillus wiedmannii]MBZ4226406.1 stage II sporulation protein M [Bacillus wiedmannii]